MRTSSKGVNLIKSFEGYSPVPYLCPANYLTIGYGHVVQPGQYTKIDKDQAEDILENDLRKFERGVAGLIKVPVTQGQFDALVSFSFNLGLGALQRSTLRMKLNRYEYNDAADEFLKWVRGGGRVLKGLVLRRQAERQLFLSK